VCATCGDDTKHPPNLLFFSPCSRLLLVLAPAPCSLPKQTTTRDASAERIVCFGLASRQRAEIFPFSLEIPLCYPGFLAKYFKFQSPRVHIRFWFAAFQVIFLTLSLKFRNLRSLGRVKKRAPNSPRGNFLLFSGTQFEFIRNERVEIWRILAREARGKPLGS
jgi:hypothetical protein